MDFDEKDMSDMKEEMSDDLENQLVPQEEIDDSEEDESETPETEESPEVIEEVSIDLRGILNEVKLREKFSSDNETEDIIDEKVKKEASYVKMENLNGSDDVEKIIDLLSGGELEEEDAYDTIVSRLVSETGLEEGVIKEVYDRQELRITEIARQASRKGQTIKDFFKKSGKKALMYGATGAVLGLATGGVGAGLGIAGARLVDTYISGRKDEKKLLEEQIKIKEGMKEAGSDTREVMKSSLVADLALAKQMQIDGVVFGGDDDFSNFVKRRAIENFVYDNLEATMEERSRVYDSLVALDRVDRNNSHAEELMTMDLSIMGGIKDVSKHLGFLGGGHSMSEKMATAGVFSIASFVARETPIVRQALLGFAGFKVGEAIGEYQLSKSEKFSELNNITSEQLGSDPDLLERATVQLSNKKFKDSNPKEYVSLKEQVDQINADNIVRAESSLDFVDEHYEKISGEYGKRLRLENKREAALLKYRASGAVAGLIGGILLGGSVDAHSEVESASASPVVETPEAETVSGSAPLETAPTAEEVSEKLSVSIPETSPESSVETPTEGATPEGITAEDIAQRQNDFVREHSLLEATGADIKVGDNGEFGVTYEVGQDSEYQHLDQVLRRIVVQEFNVGEDSKFDMLEAARAENVIANLRVVLSGTEVAGIKPESLEGIVSYSDGQLVIEDYSKFDDLVLNPLFERADNNITLESGAMSYVNETSVNKWQEMLDLRASSESGGEPAQVSFEDRAVETQPAATAEAPVVESQAQLTEEQLTRGSLETSPAESQFEPLTKEERIEKLIRESDILKKDNGSLDKTQVLIAKRLIADGYDSESAYRVLEVTKPLHWNVKNEMLLSRMLANYTDRGALSDFVGKKLFNPGFTSFKQEGSSLIFSNLGERNFTMTIDLQRDKILATGDMNMEVFKLDNIGKALKYIARFKG